MCAVLIRNNREYYTGQLLVAPPSPSNNSVFDKAIIYIISHNDSGAIGLIVNHPLNDINCATIFHSFDLSPTPKIREMPVYFGGPVETERGFILHSDDYDENAIFKLGNNMALSSSLTILKDIAKGIGPKNSIFTLGYSGWEDGQLEEEIANNNWIVIPYSEDLIFNNNSNKWQKAIQSLGIELYSYSSHIGHA